MLLRVAGYKYVAWKLIKYIEVCILNYIPTRKFSTFILKILVIMVIAMNLFSVN